MFYLVMQRTINHKISFQSSIQIPNTDFTADGAKDYAKNADVLLQKLLNRGRNTLRSYD